MPNLIICDCETTGLNEQKDHIVEIALVAVELPTFQEVASFACPVLPPLWPTVKRNMHEKVVAMHEASGLMALIDEGLCEAAHLVEGEAIAFVRKWSPHTVNWQTPLAGANPDFDRRFLKQRMAKLHAMFHYRNFDVRSITQLQDWVFGRGHVESPHRALPDARKAAADVRAFLGLS